MKYDSQFDRKLKLEYEYCLNLIATIILDLKKTNTLIPWRKKDLKWIIYVDERKRLFKELEYFLVRMIMKIKFNVKIYVVVYLYLRLIFTFESYFSLNILSYILSYV